MPRTTKTKLTRARAGARATKPSAERAVRVVKTHALAPLLERLCKSQEEAVEMTRQTQAILRERHLAKPRSAIEILSTADVFRALRLSLNADHVELVSVSAGFNLSGFDADGDPIGETDDNELVMTFRVDPSDARAKSSMQAFGRAAATEMLRAGSAPAPETPAADAKEPSAAAPEPVASDVAIASEV